MVKEAVKLIRKMRIEKNYSQEYVASKLNISQSYYGRIENSKANLDLKTLDEILEVLEIDCIDFFTKIKVSKN
jgi:transcriptional regulator with XRE-family HTH domain